MRKAILSLIAIATFIFISCATGADEQAPATAKPAEAGAPDSMIYGLACDGTNDSVVVLLLFSGEDPKTYNIEEAKAHNKIIGQLQIGDWIGVQLNPEDSTEATMVVDLDQLKGTWTYEVRPTWKDSSKMSARALRMKMAEIPDSLREAYLVPREYGFTLSRGSVASSVGRVFRSSSLEDDSPVEYPPVKNYTGWKCRNGRLILISQDKPVDAAKDAPQGKEIRDTLDFVMLSQDSLILLNGAGNQIHFHRIENAYNANDKAKKAAEKTSTATKNVVDNK